jgi:hypothetical protein
MKKRRVCQYDKTTQQPLGTYGSIHEAQELYHVSHISEVCHGRRKSDGGYIWRYADADRGKRNSLNL